MANETISKGTWDFVWPYCKPVALRWAVVDIRDEIAKFEREKRKWPRSRSCSKPYPNPPKSYDAAVEHAKEEFYRWHSMKLVLDE